MESKKDSNQALDLKKQNLNILFTSLEFQQYSDLDFLQNIVTWSLRCINLMSSISETYLDPRLIILNLTFKYIIQLELKILKILNCIDCIVFILMNFLLFVWQASVVCNSGSEETC